MMMNWLPGVSMMKLRGETGVDWTLSGKHEIRALHQQCIKIQETLKDLPVQRICSVTAKWDPFFEKS